MIQAILIPLLVILLSTFTLMAHADSPSAPATSSSSIAYNISISPVWWQYSEQVQNKLPEFATSTPLSSQARGKALQTQLLITGYVDRISSWQWQVTTTGLVSAWNNETWQINTTKQRNQLRLQQWEISASAAYVWHKTTIGLILLWINQKQSRQNFSQNATRIIVNNDIPVNENIKILAAGVRIAGQTPIRNGQLHLSLLLATPLRVRVDNDLLAGHSFSRSNGILWRISWQWLGKQSLPLIGGIPVLGLTYHARLLQGEQTAWGLWPRNRWRQLGFHAGIKF